MLMMSFTKMMLTLSLMSMYWWRKNIITLLISLESLLITLFNMLYSSQMTPSTSTLLIMLVMMASGSTLGLSMLVAMSKSHNSLNSIPINNLTYNKINITFYNYNNK